MDRNHFVEKKLHEIAHVLFQYIRDRPKESLDNLGLYSGKSGIILFLSHYLNKYPDRELNGIYEKYLSDFFEALTDVPQGMLSYCSGLAGILTVFRMMNDASLIDLDFSEIEVVYNDRMLRWVSHCFPDRNYDFLHGALGVAMYFANNPQYIEATLLGLKNTAIEDGYRLKWLSSLGIDKPDGYNISLSHGISSIIVYLSRVYRSGAMTALNKQLLDGAVNYVLSQEIDRYLYGSCFPSQSLENGDSIARSRLAWCYGDLGVAAALWQAGKVTGNKDWQDKALDVYRFSAGRMDLQDAMVHDAGLCHGTSGIAMMYAYMYRETSDPQFGNARDHWIAQTLAMSKFPDGPAGYKQLSMDDDKQSRWEDCYLLLEGIAGIGFMFLSLLNTNAEKNLLTAFALY